MVEFQILSELLEQLEDVLGCLKLHSSLEERSDHLVVNLDVLGLLGEENEALSIFFEAFASLKEHDESLERVLVNPVVVLQQVLEG